MSKKQSIHPAVVDFETGEIQGRPHYPPVPVGFSIKIPEMKKSRYYAWGYPTNNNCTYEEACEVLQALWESDLPILFHNAKFDVDVAQSHMGCGDIAWDRIHDSMFLLFLHDPHAPSLGLKQSAEQYLGMPPEEQEAVRTWLVKNKVCRANDAKWGRFIDKAPGDLVGKYADGDVVRTLKLFELLYPEIELRGLLEAYNRERELMPILLENERQGVRVDLPALEKAVEETAKHLEFADNWLRKALKTPDLNLDADADVAEALDRAGVIKEWTLTATGKKSIAKKNMPLTIFTDKKIASVFGYRGRLATCRSTFMLPWLEMARASGGVIYTNWNQVRQSSSQDRVSGARTGRLSSNPNFQNIPKSFEGKDDGYEHPKFLSALPPLPLMRQFILPDKGQVFCHRDYNQQELRILAHYEDAALLEAYQADPRLDVHTFVQEEIKSIYGTSLDRSAVKILNFGMIYGMGMEALSSKLQTSVEEARKIKASQKKAIPGLAELEKSTKERGKAGDPIITWGGRQYYSEEPKMINGRMQDFHYKLLNYLIQGSAADCTKQALINYHNTKQHGRLLLTVHDEINISVPKKYVKSEMEILRQAMQSVPFDVPMLSDGKTGDKWGSLTKYKEK